MATNVAHAAAYEAAWTMIADGLGTPFNEGLEDARHLVGDRALLDLLDRFDPPTVLIACGCVTANIVLAELNERFGNGAPPEPVLVAVQSAHRAWQQTDDGRAFVQRVGAQRDDYERAFLDAARDDPRIGQMRAFLAERRRIEGP